MFAEGAKNISWPYLSPLRRWDSLTMTFLHKFEHIHLSISIFIYLYIHISTYLYIYVSIYIYIYILETISHLRHRVFWLTQNWFRCCWFSSIHTYKYKYLHTYTYMYIYKVPTRTDSQYFENWKMFFKKNRIEKKAQVIQKYLEIFTIC